MKNKGKFSKGSGSMVSADSPEAQPLSDTGQGQTGMELKKSLGLFDGVAIIVGVIIGAGIFVSPKGVLLHSGSVGVGLIVWVLSGIMSMVGALCYAELGTMLPMSGGDYIYISKSFGPLPGFLFLWVALLIIVPTGNAILALTFSYYLMQPFWPECSPPDTAVRLLSAAVIAFLTAVNCYNVKWGASLQKVSSAMKIGALLIITIAGLVVLCKGKTENFEDPFEGTTTNPGNIALSFYSGLFSYAGWNYLNFVTEELKDPYKNLPRAIWISLPTVTIVYTLANVAYLVVLTKDELLNSNAVAVSFGDQILGPMAWIIPLFVAVSTFGALNGGIFSPSRLVFVGAREGHLPRALALINYETFTPIPALVFLGLLSIGMLIIDDVYILINYLSFVEALAMTVSVAGLLWLRIKDPDAERPIKMPLIVPIIFLIICVFLIAVPLFTSDASEIGVAVIIVASGIPVYLFFIYWKNKPKLIQKIGAKVDRVSAIFFKGVLDDSYRKD